MASLRGATERGPIRRGLWGFVALVSTLGAGQVAAAEEASLHTVPAYTLDEALAYARQHQPQIRSALAELAARKAEARVPRAGWMPQVGAVVELFAATSNNTSAVYLNVPEVDLPRIGATPGHTTDTTSWRPSPSTLAGLSLTQEVYDFGRIAARASTADALAAVAETDVEAARLDGQLAVEEAFHGVLAAREVLRATEDAYARATTHRDFAQAGTRSGLRPPIDLTRAQADVAQLGVRRIRARSGLQISRAALAAAMGAESTEVDATSISTAQSVSPAFDEVLRLAIARNPVVLAASAHLDAQRATTRALTRELLPNLFASAGLSGRAGGAAPSNGDVPYGGGWLPDVANWHVGLVASWNIFDGAALARRAASTAREEAARAELELARVSVGLGAQRSYLELDAAVQALPGLEESVTAARANQAQAEARFKAGLGTVVELADAETLLTRAQLELAVGEFSVARTRAALGHVMGQSTATAASHAGKKP